MKNTFWAVYNKRGKVVSVSKLKADAIRNQDWIYLLKDGYKIIKSEVRPVK